MLTVTVNQAIDQWIAECCELSGKCTTKALYASYEAFCNAREYPYASLQAFALQLRSLGIERARTNADRLHRGISLVAQKQQSCNKTTEVTA